MVNVIFLNVLLSVHTQYLLKYSYENIEEGLLPMLYRI